MAKEATEQLPGALAASFPPYGRPEMRPPVQQGSGIGLGVRNQKPVRRVVLSCGY